MSRSRVLDAALALADEEGVEALSMRKVASRLSVEAMSLYKHVTNKDDVLDGLVDLVLEGIELPPSGTPWRRAMRERAMSARRVLLRHPWAAALIESRLTPSGARLRYADSVLGLLRNDGFSVLAAYRSFLLLDSYLYGFTLQELHWPFEEGDRADTAAALLPQIPEGAFPHLVEVMEHVLSSPIPAGSPGRHDMEFEHGLDLLLESLERLRGS